MKIFVSLAAYCDQFLPLTIQSAVEHAGYPERLVFGIADQHPERRSDLIGTLVAPKMFRYVHLNPIDSRGVSWARNIVFSLYGGEEYILQVDSHTIFEQNWDVQLIELHTKLSAQLPKPIISTYPYGFEMEGNTPTVKVRVSDKTVLVLRPHPESSLENDNATLRFRAEHVSSDHPLLGYHLAGGFIFTSGDFVQEIPYDPYLYFHGEEQSLAVRAFTRGWDIVHPKRIPLYHLYKQPHTAHMAHHWHPEWEKQRNFSRIDLQNKARERVMELLFQRTLVGAYGLGSVRTLEEFAAHSGIDYAGKVIQTIDPAKMVRVIL
ncbi:GlcNAc-transferase family protein [Chrysiogenes arsenatis]|uniref:GlcNAc-transferase family protein n=1 Tax=Chrysiogenes arsenatis TaxID=309797 RepID=UPI000427450A|nr:GlcNAc-transferase family protein [Chrysiogenes arsenatis]